MLLYAQRMAIDKAAAAGAGARCTACEIRLCMCSYKAGLRGICDAMFRSLVPIVLEDDVHRFVKRHVKKIRTPKLTELSTLHRPVTFDIYVTW